jgi:hypothetical protein
MRAEYPFGARGGVADGRRRQGPSLLPAQTRLDRTPLAIVSAARRPGRRRGHGARSAAHPAEAAGACCRPGQVPGLAAADVDPVTR